MKNKQTNNKQIDNTDCVACCGLNRERARRTFLDRRHEIPTQRQARKAEMKEPVVSSLVRVVGSPETMPVVAVACNH